MSSTLRRQLSENDQKVILERHGRVCYATGHEIPTEESLQFDHIRAFSVGGHTVLNNIAPMCARHNQQKGTLSLHDFRTKLRMDEFFDRSDRHTLRDLLRHLDGQNLIDDFATQVTPTRNTDAGTITLESAYGRETFPILVDPILKWEYFFAHLSVSLLDSDDAQEAYASLQPRYLIRDKVFSLFRHFQTHPVLQPSLGRLVDNRHIRLFDGQHKAAALLWNGHNVIECKIFLEPDLRLLNQTNIDAHDSFSQTRFYSSVMVDKLGKQFGSDFETYKGLDDREITEAGFVEYLRQQDNLTKAQVNKRFHSYLYSSILDDEGNKLRDLTSAANRRTAERPLTTDLLTRSIFADFLCRSPLDDVITSDRYMRDEEARNITHLLNELYSSALFSWDPKASKRDLGRVRLERIFASKSMMAWVGILKDAVCAKLEIRDSDERARPFYREQSDEQRKQVSDIVGRLTQWKEWDAPINSGIDRFLADNRTALRQWFKDHGLDAGYLMGAIG